MEANSLMVQRMIQLTLPVVNESMQIRIRGGKKIQFCLFTLAHLPSSISLVSIELVMDARMTF